MRNTKDFISIIVNYPLSHILLLSLNNDNSEALEFDSSPQEFAHFLLKSFKMNSAESNDRHHIVHTNHHARNLL